MIKIIRIVSITKDSVETSEGTFENPLHIQCSNEKFMTLLEKFKPFFACDKEQFLTSTETAKYIGVSVNTLRNMHKDGRLIPIKTKGGHRRYELSQIIEYINREKLK